MSNRTQLPTLRSLLLFFFLRKEDFVGTVQWHGRGKADSTLRSSQAVPHPSTDRALRCLTSEVKRDPVHSARYGRRRHVRCRIRIGTLAFHRKTQSWLYAADFRNDISMFTFWSLENKKIKIQIPNSTKKACLAATAQSVP